MRSTKVTLSTIYEEQSRKIRSDIHQNLWKVQNIIKTCLPKEVKELPTKSPGILCRLTQQINPNHGGVISVYDTRCSLEKKIKLQDMENVPMFSKEIARQLRNLLMNVFKLSEFRYFTEDKVYINLEYDNHKTCAESSYMFISFCRVIDECCYPEDIPDFIAERYHLAHHTEYRIPLFQGIDPFEIIKMHLKMYLSPR
jgi:hypothetical protein